MQREISYNWILKFLKLKNEMYKQITRAQWVDEKNWVICLVSYHAYSQSYSHWNIKCQIWLIFCISIFCWWKQKISHSFGKICKCISNILSSLFWKYYGLFWTLKYKISVLLIFFYICTLNRRTVTQTKIIKSTIPFSERFRKKSSRCTWKYCYQQKNIRKMSHFWYFIYNDHTA